VGVRFRFRRSEGPGSPVLPVVTLNASDPTASETGPATGTFTVTRTGATTDALTVLYTVGGTATNGDDYTTLTGSVQIAIGQTSATITVTPITDSDTDGDQTVILTLAPSADYAIGTPGSGTVTIADSLPLVSILATDATATEASTTTGAFTITRTGSTGSDLTVYVTVGGTATITTDYTTSPDVSGGTVTISSGQASRVVTVTPVNDTDFEGSQTVILTLASDAAYSLLGNTTATVTIEDNDAPATPAGEHPRLWYTVDQRTTVQGLVGSDTNYAARLQTAITDFKATGGPYANNSTDTLNIATLAFLMGLRTDTDGLGLNWAGPAQTGMSDSAVWTADLTRITNAITTWTYTQSDKRVGMAISTVYDCLYDYLTSDQRTYCQTKIAAMLVSGYQWQSQGGQWNDQTSTEHMSMMCLSIASEDFLDRADKVIQEAHDWADAHEFMQNGEGLGYAWKNAYASNTGPVMCNWMIRNAYGLSDADSVEHCLKDLRDAASQLRVLCMPHGGYNSPSKWMQVRVNFMAPDAVYHRGANIGTYMLWAQAILEGRANVNPGAEYSHTALANNESDLFAWWKHISDQETVADRRLYRAATNYKWAQSGSPANEKAYIHAFFSLCPWLIANVQPPAAKTSTNAGIAKVWRWWPDALNWITIVGGTWESTDQSLITYHHRRYWNNNYTAGTYVNGMWQVFRDGQLLFKRGSTSHGPLGKHTCGANGTVGLIDLDTYEEFERGTGDIDIAYYGGLRTGTSHDHYADILADPTCDFGRITGWYSDSDIVAITDDLTLSYNSSQRTTDGAAKLSSFTREWVCCQRGADGSDHERIIVYDRIAMLGSGRYQPRLNLCPPLNPTIDGTETAYTPWYPDPNGVGVNEPWASEEPVKVGWPWKATGPVRWDYASSSRLDFDAANLPNPPYGGTTPGGGKVRVTWLKPSGSEALVQKRGGLNSYFDPAYNSDDTYAHCPAFTPEGALMGYDGQWRSYNNTTFHAQVGLYTVQVYHNTFNANTRFLIGVDVMGDGGTASSCTELTCDGASVAARVGAFAACFKEATGTRTSGTVTIPSGVTLVALCNLAPSAARTLSAGAGLTIASSTTPTSSDSGVVKVTVSGNGVLTWS
jgi:hypothetical protein